MFDLNLLVIGFRMFCVALPVVYIGAVNAGIYTSIAEDGTVKWSTQALDKVSAQPAALLAAMSPSPALALPRQ